MNINCKINNGKSSHLDVVTVTVATYGLSFSYDDENHQWSYESMTHEIFGSDEHLLNFDDFTLYVKESDWSLIAENMKNAKVKNNFSVPVLLGTAVALFLIYLVAIPIISNIIADNLPVSVEKGISSILVKKFSEKDSCQFEGRDKLFKKALSKLNEKDNFEFFVVNLLDPNAFAVPGNIIVFSTGALNSFKTEEEFLGVLAHEIQHHKHRHHLRKIVKLGFTSVLWNVAISSVTGFIALDPEIVQLLIQRKYGSQDEKEADVSAIRMLEENGVSGRGLYEFFEQLKKDQFTNTYLERAFSTHPATEDRISYLKDLVKLKKSTNRLYTEEEWQLLKNGCNKMKIKTLELLKSLKIK